ncbi:hypothetical protein [Xenorhabdus eapokensis]|uniref:Uncharacterized protein n=1 Tax=Xenorhabdus eapokensis TaxID=1873482 RepID=A0A1Q5TYU7_9GAMM|nr:hypothetical protein [Xenorhabdus eapokensis]OKP05398.1 hypothetical protein Xedl_00629 [Xenorhabdus eapokensis]
MKIKGSYCLFFILSVWFSQALALDLSYQGDIPADNKPSQEYLKKRDKLHDGNWDREKLVKDNALAEKQESEQRKYSDRSSYSDWYRSNHFVFKDYSPNPQGLKRDMERIMKQN